MSTRTRDSAPAKEKRGTSPSRIGTAATTQRRRSLDHPKTNSSDTTASGKNVPNYLRATASSTNDVPKQLGKKPVSSTTDSANNPTLARRRSFDKPPSPSRTQKSRVSPSPTSRVSPSSTLRSTSSFSGKTSTSTKSTFRSSSFSGKISTSPKGVPERNVKGPKDVGKQHTLYARPVNSANKSNVLAKKHDTGSGSSRKERVVSASKKVDKSNVHDVPEPEPLSEDHESFVAEEQTLLVGNDNEKEFEDSLLEDQEPININEQTEEEILVKGAQIVTTESPTILEQHDANVVTVESPTILDNKDDKVVAVEHSTGLEHQDASLGVKTKELEDKSPFEEISSQQEGIKDQATDETNNTNIDESVAGNANEEVENNVREQEMEEEETEVNKEEETGLNKKEEVDGGSESHESPKEKVEQEVVVEEKNEAENATPRVAHGKKDVALSNNVIEETASKLREQRKNKVKALAGAFETVISLQEPK